MDIHCKIKISGKRSLCNSLFDFKTVFSFVFSTKLSTKRIIWSAYSPRAHQNITVTCVSILTKTKKWALSSNGTVNIAFFITVYWISFIYSFKMPRHSCIFTAQELWRAFAFSYFSKFDVDFWPCAYVRTLCTRFRMFDMNVIVWCICAYPLHIVFWLWHLCICSYQVHNEPIDGSSHVVICYKANSNVSFIILSDILD